MATRAQWMAKLREVDAAASAGNAEAIADFQKIQARILELDAKGGYDADPAAAPAEDKRGFMERARSDGVMSAVGDYAKGTYNNMTDPQQWKDALWRGSHDSQGRNIGEQLMAGPTDLVPAMADQADIAGDDLSFGLYPRAVDALTGSTYQTDKVKGARERAGSAGTGMDMAMAAAMPSRTAQAAAGPLTKAAGYGLEGAAYSGLRPVLEGADQRDVLAAMALGGGLSAGASIGSRFLPGGSERDIPRRGPYPNDKSLFKDVPTKGKLNAEQRDLKMRSDKVKDLRIAATKGQPGMREYDAAQIDANKAAKGYGQKEPFSYDERLMTSEAAHQGPPKGLARGSLDAVTKMLGFGEGGSILKAMPAAWKTGGASVVGGAALDSVGQALTSKAGRRQVDEIASYIRNNGLGQMPTSVSPELANQLRDYVAKSMRTSGSKR